MQAACHKLTGCVLIQCKEVDRDLDLVPVEPMVLVEPCVLLGNDSSFRMRTFACRSQESVEGSENPAMVLSRSPASLLFSMHLVNRARSHVKAHQGNL